MMPYSMGMNAFQTQADQRFNSFSDPMNPVNLNGGSSAGWGIDSAYMTPSYMSPYRPAYQGPSPSVNGPVNPGFFNSFNNIFNPFAAGGTNYGGQSYAQNNPFYTSLINKPMDAAMSFGQNFVAPGLFGIAAYKFLSKPAESIGRGFGYGLARGTLGATGLNASHMGSATRLFGGGGAMLSSAALPFMAAQAATSALDAAVFDPYIHQREMSSTLQRNFAGVSFGDSSGNRVTGGGFSRYAASQQARSLSIMGARDQTFNQGEVSQLTDYSARAGLLDNVNGNQIADRMKSIIKQVKVVMAVANTSDFKEAIETISRLQSAGANPASMSSLLGAMSAHSAVAGTSVSRMMNTVGSQGQFLFQSNGLTPFVGQLTAAQAHSSFEAAFRSGLISPSALARLGGKEGATQSSVSGQLAMAQSPLFGIMGHNALFGGGASGSIVQNMGRFGGSMTSNPIEAMGNFNLMRPAVVSKLLADGGMERIQEMLGQVADVTPGARRRGGKIGMGTAYQLMTQTMGLTDDQARAMLEQYRSYQDPTVAKQMETGFGKAKADAWLKQSDQMGFNRGFLTGPLQAISYYGRAAVASSSDAIGGMLGYSSSLSDSLEAAWTRGIHGMSADRGAVSADRNGAYGKIVGNRRSLSSSSQRNSIKAINDLASKGDQDAKAFMAAKGTARQDLLVKLAKDGKISSEFKDGDAAREFGNLLDNKFAISYVTDKSNSASSALNEAWSKVYTQGGQVGLATDEWISMTDDAAKMLSSNRVGSEEWNALKSRFEKKMGRSLNTGDIQKFVDKAAISTESSGAYGRGEVWKAIEAQGFKSAEEFHSALSTNSGYEDTLSKLLGRKVSISKDGRMTDADIGVELSKKLGSNVLERRRDLSDIKYSDPGQLREHHEAINSITQEHAKYQRLRENGIIDFNTEAQMHTALEMGKSINKFSEAVDKFDAKVNDSSSPDVNKPWFENLIKPRVVK